MRAAHSTLLPTATPIQIVGADPSNPYTVARLPKVWSLGFRERDVVCEAVGEGSEVGFDFGLFCSFFDFDMSGLLGATPPKPYANWSAPKVAR